jgi:hypothetical protein
MPRSPFVTLSKRAPALQTGARSLVFSRSTLRVHLNRKALCARSLRFVSVMLHMKLGCFGRMVSSVLRMSVSRVCVMSGRLVIARLVMLGGVPMMFRCACVVLRCLMMVFGCLFRHISSSSSTG